MLLISVDDSMSLVAIMLISAAAVEAPDDLTQVATTGLPRETASIIDIESGNVDDKCFAQRNSGQSMQSELINEFVL